MRLFLTLFFLFLPIINGILSLDAWAKIEAPNYKFQLSSLEPYFPGEEINEEKLKKDEFNQFDKKGIYLKKIRHQSYLFDLFIQLDKNSKIISMIARLPQYFLHDQFHQTLINKFKKQNHYFNRNEHSVYQWDNEKYKIIYEGACTITCFPIYLFMHLNNSNEEDELRKILKFI